VTAIERGAPGVADVAREIGRDVAAAAAASVDSDNRFPHEAFQALRDVGLLGLLVPRDLGGLGGRVTDVCEAGTALAAECLSTGLIWAMHSQQVAIMADHASAQWREPLREIAAQGHLVASATTEPEKGGALLLAHAPLNSDADGVLHIDRPSPVVSYGAEAEYYLVTVRGGPEEPQTNVRFVLLSRSHATITSGWDAMGMRGTRSVAMRFTGDVRPDQVLEGDFRGVITKTAVPVAHLAWTSVWYGGARGALNRLVSALRDAKASERRQLGSEVFRVRLGEIRMSLDLVAAMLAHLLQRYEAMRADESPASAFDDPDWTIALNGLKVAGSRLTFSAVDGLIGIAGLARGYLRNDALGLERTFRDLRSAALMVNNDQLLQINAKRMFIDS
jgi:acyl-CoA dehydrogenase